MNQPSETEIAYTAGIIDGEGCITITRQKGQYKFQYRLMIVVMNTNEEVLERLQRKTGLGNVHLFRHPSGTRKGAWQWRISGEEAYSLLLMIQPYLIIKRRDAEIAIEFFNLPKNDYSRQLNRVDEAERERLFFLISEGRNKNHKQISYEHLS